MGKLLQRAKDEWKILLTFILLIGFAVAGIIWAAWLVTEVTLTVFSDKPPAVPSGTAAAYATLFGLPALIIVGMWKGIQEIRKNLMRGKNDE